MDDRDILDALLELLGNCQVEIRKVPLGGQGGGLCRLRDRVVFFADTDASVGETTALAAQAVRQKLDIEGVYLRPQIREIMDRYRSTDSAVRQDSGDLQR
ncbi:MAG: hypothetical protein GX455_00095 [Phycisphaerae bacterium]|nr:hypothetical protein [Phycisphaerae bacterium]